MKNLIFAILCLSALTAWFSFRGEIVPFERTQKEGWAFYGGTTGDSVPSEGADGKTDTFIINDPQETAAQQDDPQRAPISVTVTADQEEPEPDADLIICAVAAGVLAAEYIAAGALAIIHHKTK